MRKNKTSDEKKELLNSFILFITEPALIIDTTTKCIIAINDAFSFLSGFDPEEVIGNSLEKLLSTGFDDSATNQNAIPCFLSRKLFDPILIKVSRYHIEKADNVLLLKLLATQNEANQSFIDGAVFAQDLEFIGDSAGLDQAYDRALIKLRSVYKSDDICIYQKETDQHYLTKVASLESDSLVFPQTLPISDFIYLINNQNWENKAPAVTELIKSAKSADLKQVVTYPLGNEEALFGLITIGWTATSYEDFNSEYLRIIATTLSRYYKTTIKMHNIASSVFDLKSSLTLRNSQLESISQGLLVVQPDFSIVEMNTAAEFMLGFSDKEVRGQPVENIIIGAEGLMSALKSALSGVGIHDIGNFSIHRRDGQTIPVKLQALPVILEKQVVSLLIIIDDISEHQQYQLRAQHLEQRAILGEFSAVFAHEVRNPVNNISTGLQLLEMKMPKNDPNLDNISRMQADCQRINHLMESVLAFSRPIEPAMENIDMIFLIRRILDKWHPRFVKVNVEPYFQFEGEIPKVRGDSRSLERVFINLIGNAVEAMKDTGGILSVKMRVTSELAGMPHVEIAVSDTGPGIPDEIKEDMFKPFVSTTSNGTGLGLAISYRIVTGHKGTMKFKTFPGGTVFYVYLPIHNGEARA